MNTEQEIRTTAYKLLNLIKNDREKYKNPQIHDAIMLCIEYLTLDGLEDAGRAFDIDIALTACDPDEWNSFIR